ncbi:Aminopeptidase Y (Arg, Lys, Leu preference) [Alloactinosynnema sp. L-07]|nr:Aminopeptidase Y (Arg, Lys, Leu preference) [Alloactinosynnema sp. L-07]
MQRIAVTAAALILVPLSPALSAQAEPDVRGGLAEKLVRKVTIGAVHRHLIAFQRIADRNGGNRADPSPGARESLDYVAERVRAAGFEVTIQEFGYDRRVIDAESLTVAATRVVPDHMTGSPQTPVGGLTAGLVVVPADSTTGCEPEDYTGIDVAGAIVLIRRGGCSFVTKERVAADAGAIAGVVYNNSPGPMGGEVNPATARIPMVGLVGVDGTALIALAGKQATLDARHHIEPTNSRNLIASTRTGRRDNAVIVGAHLDSLPAVPGINENATSVAAMLETALQLGGSPKVNNSVRFIWWGGDWDNTGSDAYLRSLSFEQQLDIALHIELEAIGSPNGGYFVFDGDGSSTGGSGPYGSGQIEQAFADYYASRGIATEPTKFPGPGAYSDFMPAGIPTGGLFSGLFHTKTQAQAEKWGGTAGALFDPCNHSVCDNLGNINRDLLDKNADAVAHITGRFARSTRDVNGVESRAHRASVRQAATRQAAGISVVTE